MKFDLYNWVKIDESDYQGLWAFCLCYAFTIIRFFINNKKKYKRKYKRISQILRIQIILILIDILLNLPKKVGRQLDEKSVSSRRSILPRK